MSPVFAARRRAEEFDSLVEAVAAGPVEPARYAELLELVGVLRDAPPVEPRPAFVADLRERLMTAAETELVAGPGPTPDVQDRLSIPRRSPRERRLAAAVGGFAIIGATTSMAVAAQSALPGDVLYPLKRAIENAHTGLSVDDEQKGSTLLANASGRLEEVERLTRATEPDRVDVRMVEETLAVFTAQATQASDLLLAAYDHQGDDEALADLQEFTNDSFTLLNDLAAVANDEIREALVPVGNTLAAIEAAIQQACPTCEVSLTELPQWLLTEAPQTVGSTLSQLLSPGSAPGTSPTGPKAEPDQGQQGDPPPAQPGAPAGIPAPAVPLPTPGVPAPTGGSGSGGSGSGGSGSDAKPPATKPGKNPVRDLVDGLLGTGGSGAGTGTPAPEIPIVTDTLEGVGDLVGGLLNPPKPTPRP